MRVHIKVIIVMLFHARPHRVHAFWYKGSTTERALGVA